MFVKQVREQQWSCLREVLRSLQGTMLIDPASEAITELFKKWFPCGEPIAVGSPGRTVARPAMFVLDTLTECLFLMSTKYKLAILNDFKIILELLRSPVTTRRITDCLRNLCDNNPSPDVPPPLLLDLLCSLAHSVYKNENPIEHNTKFTARLLSIGVAKIYSSNRQLCVMKLPVVFNALKGMYTCCIYSCQMPMTRFTERLNMFLLVFFFFVFDSYNGTDIRERYTRI